MSLIYITGISGSGKTTVRQELRERGYAAYGTDEDDLAAFYNNETGKMVAAPKTAAERTPEWRSQHSWRIIQPKIEALARQAKDKTIFLCGVASNDEEVWDLFAKVFALILDDETLRHRITTRSNNNFGQNPHELQTILEWQRFAREGYKALGAELIDATQPVETVVDTILARLAKG